MRVDIHHHFVTRNINAEDTAKFVRAVPEFEQVLRWTPERSIEEMDEFAIDAAVICITAIGFTTSSRQETAAAVRANNEYGAEVVRRHNGRFGLFADLPLPFIDESLAEIDYAFDSLGVDGIRLQSSYGTERPGDPQFAPIFESLNDRRAVVFVHPVAPSYGEVLTIVPPAVMEFPFDTTRAIVNLIYSGTLSRNEHVRFIFAHGGGTIAMLAHRVVELMGMRSSHTLRPEDVFNEYKNLYFDVVSVANPVAFKSMYELAGADKLLLGSDFPYFSIGKTLEGLGQAELTDNERMAIEGNNALSLLPRLRRA